MGIAVLVLLDLERLSPLLEQDRDFHVDGLHVVPSLEVEFGLDVAPFKGPTRNRPCRSTSGTPWPVPSSTSMAGTPASLATRASSAPNVGAVCTMPVPSSVVTKSPGMTWKASSGESIGKAQSSKAS